LDSGATAQCELVLTAPSRNSLTYLLTYLLKQKLNLVMVSQATSKIRQWKKAK